MNLLGFIFITTILIVHHYIYLYGMIKKANWYYYPEKARFKWLITHQSIREIIGIKGLIFFGIFQVIVFQFVYWYVVLDMFISS